MRRRLMRAIVGVLAFSVLGIAPGAAQAASAPSTSLSPATTNPDATPSSSETSNGDLTQTYGATSTPSAHIVSVGDPILAAGADLTVSVAISNPTSNPLVITDARLRAQNRTPISRTRLLDFLAGSSVTLLTIQVLPDAVTVPAGETSTIDFHVARADIPWDTSSSQWGPRGIEVSLTSEDSTLTDRSVVILAPDYSLEPMPTSVVVPLTLTSEELMTEPLLSDVLQESFGVAPGSAPSTEPSEAADAANPEKATAGGAPNTAAAQSLLATNDGANRIADALHMLSIAGVTVALDPSVVSNDSALMSANSFSATAGTELLLTPLFDADAQGLLDSGNAQTLAEARTAGAAAAQSAGVQAHNDIAVLTPTSDQTTIAGLVAQGVTGVVVPGNEVAPLGYRYSTPSARMDLTADPDEGTTVPALATDTTASAALAGELVNDGEVASTAEAPTTLSALDSRQAVLALSAITYRERPNDPRATVLAIDREGLAYYGLGSIASAGKDDALYLENLRGTLTALMSAPWVTPATVSDLMNSSPSADERDSLPRDTAITNAITAAQVADIAASIDSISVVAGLSSNPGQVTEPAGIVASQLYSTAWRANPKVLTTRIQALADTANFFTSSLEVLPSSTIRVVSQQTELPIHLTNTLPFSVGAVIELDSRDIRLKANKPVAVTLPANSSTRVMIPIEAHGSGNIKVEAKILSPSGVQVGAAQTIEIRVRADWENIGTLILALIFAVILILGIVRSLRRGRRSPAVEPAAFKRERHAHEDRSTQTE